MTLARQPRQMPSVSTDNIYTDLNLTIDNTQFNGVRRDFQGEQEGYEGKSVQTVYCHT